jgi:hypothetical protein
MTKWKPAKRVPMIGNGRAQMGQVGPIIATAARWLIPWLAVSGGMALTSYTASKALPNVPINQKNIGISSALIGAGTVAYFISEKLPDTQKPFGYAAAVGGIAAGLYFLFKEPSPEPTPDIITSKYIPPGQEVPPWTPGQMQEAFAVYADPDQPNTGGTRRWLTGDQDYEVVVKNETNSPVSFFVGAEVYEKGSTRVYRTPRQSDPKYGRKKVTLAPAGQKGNDERVILTVPSIKGSWWESYAGPGVAVDFEFFRQADDNAPFKVSEPISIQYSFLPIG